MNLAPALPAADPDAFIARWAEGDGGQERANYALFLAELCDVLGVPRPDQASHHASANAYVFERAVTFREPDGSTAHGRIDLYKRGSFVLEAKQSRNPGGAKAIPEQGDLLAAAPAEATPRGRRTASRAWDVLMLSARRQAEDYAKALPASEGWPPFSSLRRRPLFRNLCRLHRARGRTTHSFPIARAIAFILKTCAMPRNSRTAHLIWLDPQCSTRPDRRQGDARNRGTARRSFQAS